MPCQSFGPSPYEEEIRNMNNLLLELGLSIPNDSSKLPKERADARAQKLCRWCKEHQKDVSKKSLELQIWWRDHQEADRRQAEEQKAAARKKKLVASALKKLTKEEREALEL